MRTTEPDHECLELAGFAPLDKATDDVGIVHERNCLREVYATAVAGQEETVVFCSDRASLARVMNWEE